MPALRQFEIGMQNPSRRWEGAGLSQDGAATGAYDGVNAEEVGQVVLPATPGGSPATRKRQVNVPPARNNDLPYGFGRPPILSRTIDP